jgi:hypothetical protein
MGSVMMTSKAIILRASPVDTTDLESTHSLNGSIKAIFNWTVRNAQAPRDNNLRSVDVIFSEGESMDLDDLMFFTWLLRT